MWVGREEARVTSRDEVVLTGRTWPDGGKGDGGDSGGGGQIWAGGIKEGDWNGRPPDLGQRQRVQSITINQIGTDSSVSLASLQGVEHHRPTMHTPLGHGYMQRRRRRRRRRSLQIEGKLQAQTKTVSTPGLNIAPANDHPINSGLT